MPEITNMKPPAGIEEFLEKFGWGGAEIRPVAGDASFRRYFRAHGGNGDTAIIMDAPPPHEDVCPFIGMAEYLCGAGFDAPHILGRDMDRGLLLLEDFGDVRVREYLDGHPGEERKIYEKAVDTLIRLSQAPAASVPPYDMAAYMREVELLTDWYMPAMGLSFDLREYQTIWHDLLAPLDRYARDGVTVLRDYHAENIMLLPDGRQGLIDFQDALVGHPAYDLVSLLEDARRDVPEGFQEEILQYYRDNAVISDDFEYCYAVLAAQRNSKIIGIFTRLWKRDGKEHYLSFLPRMWRYLERDLERPALANVKLWIDRNIPPKIRKLSPKDVK